MKNLSACLARGAGASGIVKNDQLYKSIDDNIV